MFTDIDPYKTLLVRLVKDNVTNIDITYDADCKMKYIKVNPVMNLVDVTQSMEVLKKMIAYETERPYPSLYDKSPEEFLKHRKEAVSERLKIFLNKGNGLSKNFQQLIAKELRLFSYTPDVFKYEESMVINYRNTTHDTINSPNLTRVDRNYFHFLKEFNLNDSQYLHTFTFTKFQNEIFQNEILDIPAIGDSTIPSWLTEVRAILSNLIGFSDGPYYDILAANAYGNQLNVELRPLTEKQKENISQYWKNGEIAKILFRKNRQVEELHKEKSAIVINDISNVDADKVLNTILSKYSNKVILIDFWATWCVPCLEAMNQFRIAKGGFKNKDVVFVYLTNESSPKKLWEKKIKGIGSEHYYLSDEQWEYLMEYFGFEGIPSYLLYDNKGKLDRQFTSFPGQEELKSMINNLLN